MKHKGILNFIEGYNFYGVDKSKKDIQVKLYKNLYNINELSSFDKRFTKDNEWVFIEEDDY